MIRNSCLKYILCICIIPLSLVVIGKIPSKPVDVIEITNNVFFDNTETTVISWMIYYRWTLETEGIDAARAILPDSSAMDPIVWKFMRNTSARYIRVCRFDRSRTLPTPFELRFVSNYKNYDKQLTMEPDAERIIWVPVTGVSYEQVIGYCRWKTKMFGNNEWVYCLPKHDDWMMIARKLLTEREWNNRMKDSVHYHKEKEFPNFNYTYPTIKAMDKFEESIGPAPALFEHGKPYSNNLFGNISEMTNIEGIAKGGNYTSAAIQAHLDSIQHYSRPEKWLGFRCIIKRKDLVDDDQQNERPIAQNEFGDLRDQKRYKTVVIGKQTWMAENLAYKPDSGSYSALFDDETYVPLYGYLYSWATAKHVCPAGWRLPQRQDYYEMLGALNITDSIIAYQELIVTGSSGFLFMNAGFRFGGNFALGEWTVPEFWLSEEENKRAGSSVSGFRFPFYYVSAGPGFGVPKKHGLPVRCIQKEENIKEHESQ